MDLLKKHYAQASDNERMYLHRDHAGRIAKQILDLFAESGLTAAQIKGCLEYMAWEVDFHAKIPKRTE